MFLRRIEIEGFKSFANKVAVDFAASGGVGAPAGVTAIVGPNGSGKSNIADAVRWVMGEQSMKSLRSKKSEDVIFAGSRGARRMNTASVTLYLDNADKRIPLPYAEVAVSRTVYRDGAGEYAINGAKVRLLDVVDALAHAGIGKGGYAIITQGMTDAFLAATPLERRAIIEDAAGVKPYQIRKQRSLARLASTKVNADRVAGLVAEITPHLRMLKRQAERAAKAEDVAALLREKQEQLYVRRWRQFRTEQAELRALYEERGSAMRVVEREVDMLSGEVERLAQAMEQASDGGESETVRRKRALSEEVAARHRAIAVADAQIAMEQERLVREVAALRTSIPVDTAYVQTHLDDVAVRLETAAGATDVPTLQQACADGGRATRTLRADVTRGTVQVDVSAQRAALETATDGRLADIRAARATATAALADAERAMEEVDTALREDARADREARATFFEKERLLRERERALTAARDAWNDSKVALARVEVREEDLARVIAADLAVVPDDLAARTDIAEATEDDTTLEQIVGRLRVQHEAIGAIDPLIIQEYRETQQRYDFLTKELADLERAAHDLQVVVREMDEKIAAAFADAYNFINKEFQTFFRMMFGGGKAALHKVAVAPREVAADDVADDDTAPNDEDAVQQEAAIGITITATPPGKNVEDLALLSGGERSLVSLSLLFAVIAFNPPPFVILDEVEAALDEANARRFGTIIGELAARTQFVIITHNRETMRHASLLYGVTMKGDGISRLLSVRLDAVASPDTADVL